MGTGGHQTIGPPEMGRAEEGGAAESLKLQKRKTRIDRWRQLASVAVKLPEAKNHADSLLTWIAKHERGLLEGKEKGEESLWAEFTSRISQFCKGALGMERSNAFSLIGYTALEHQLMQRINTADATIKSKEDLKRALRKKNPVKLEPLDLDQQRGGAKSVLGQSVKLSVKHTQRGSEHLTKEELSKYLQNPQGISPEIHLKIVNEQNRQWNQLYDEKHDPGRKRYQRDERIQATRNRRMAVQMRVAQEMDKYEKNRIAKSASSTMPLPAKPKPEILSKDDENFEEKFAKHKADRQRQRKLVKRLRNSLQMRFHNTHTLPIDLFTAFRKYDKDQSGQIDIDEFTKVCNDAGLGEAILQEEDLRTLFQQADKNDSGTVDFAEFLKVVVGNLTGI